MPTNLDFSQVIQRAYDEPNNRIRVDAEISASIIAPPGLEVSISATDDNIAIRNTSNSNELLINADGSINVNATFGGTVTVGTADKTTFTYGTSNQLSIGGVYQDTSPTLTAGQSGAVRLTEYRGFHVNLRDNSGNEFGISTNPIFSNITDGTDTLLIDADGSAQVRVTNGAGAAAVNIQDGGNTITVDGTVAVTQSTSPWIISGTVAISNFPTTVDTNYGTVGANTIRTAAQIGNVTGASDFNAGTTGAQTLRTTSNITRNGTELSYNSGTTDTNTLRVVLPTDQTAIPVTQNTSPWVTNVSQFGGSNVVTGTGTSGAGIPRVTVSSDSSIGRTWTLSDSTDSVTITPRTTTTGTPTGITVSTSAVLLAASNASRRSILITNNGSKNLFIGHTSGVTTSGATMGLLVGPNGSYTDSGPGLYTGDLYAIYSAASGSQNVSVSERT